MKFENLAALATGLVIGMLAPMVAATDVANVGLKADLQAALASPDRSSEERARDAARHPRETLQFFGLEPTMTVLELLPGKGWYSAILAPWLKAEGQLLVATPGADNSNEYLAKGHKALADRFAAAPALYERVQWRILAAPERIELGQSGSVDAVVSFRAVHNWIRDGVHEQVFKAVFDVLRPGGVFGLVQHRATDPAWQPKDAETGYVSEAFIHDLAERSGFIVEASSDINFNPRDTHDHPKGVWTLPPNLRLGEVDRDKYLAIGESDRMTLRLRKPAQP